MEGRPRLGDLGDERYFESHDEEEAKAKNARHEMQKALAEWLDANNIADLILEAIEDVGETPTLEMAKDVWLHACLDLASFIEGSVEVKCDCGDEVLIKEG